MPRTKPNKMKLTPLSVKNLKPKDRAYLVWDTTQHGLAIRVEPTGHKAWKVIYRHHGRPRWFTIDATNAIGLAEARSLAADIMYKVSQGKDPQAEKRAGRIAGTFEEVALRYREEYAKKHNRSWEQAAYLIDSYVLPRLGKLNAAAITRQDVKVLLAKIDTPSMQTQVLASLSAIFTWAIKEEVGGITINPCSKIERPKKRPRERVLSDDEVPRFWSAFDGMVGTALKILLLTGQRPGEVGHMRREHIVDGWWKMPGKPVPAIGWGGTKNEQDHRVWLPKSVQKLLAELDEDVTTGFVFAGERGGPVTDLDGAMRTICAQLGVEDKVTPHDLRRTHGTTITSLGFGRDAMNRIQNHREGGIADVYDQHKYAKENRRVMEAVASQLMALAQGRASF
jgi:integrase